MTLDEYAAEVLKSVPVVRIQGIPWRVARGILEPLAMPHTMKVVDPTLVRRAMRETGARIARWNDTWDTDPCDWWWICCDDRNYDAEKLSSHARRDVRAGLRRCEVRQVDAAWLAEHAYPVYKAAHTRYGDDVVPVPPDRFAEGMRHAARLDGHEFWACFADQTLIAYAHCIVLQNAVNLSSIKSDPDHLKALPNNALVYVLTQHYLKARGMLYVTDGSRVVHHATHVQDFLERKMGYRRIYCPLRAIFSPLARLSVASGVRRWGKYLGLPKMTPETFRKLEAVAILADIAKRCRPHVKPGH